MRSPAPAHAERAGSVFPTRFFGRAAGGITNPRPVPAQLGRTGASITGKGFPGHGASYGAKPFPARPRRRRGATVPAAATRVGIGGRVHGESILFTIFLIFTGAAVMAGLALFARQSMLVAYIALGALVGPWGLGLIGDATTAQGSARSGSSSCCTCSASTCTLRSSRGWCARRQWSPSRAASCSRRRAERWRSRSVHPARGAGDRRGLDVLSARSSG